MSRYGTKRELRSVDQILCYASTELLNEKLKYMKAPRQWINTWLKKGAKRLDFVDLSLSNFLISSARIILRQFLNLSLSNFLISSARNILRQFLNLSLSNFLISSARINLRQFLNLSLSNFFIPSARIILRLSLNLSLPQILLSKSQLAGSQLAHRMILLALVQINKDTWPSGYINPVHDHNIHSLATIHLLNSARRNSSRPPLQLLTSFLSSKPPTLSSSHQRPKEPEYPHPFSTSMMVSVSF